MKKEPFDLFRAIKGEPVVTRDGRKVEITGYPVTVFIGNVRENYTLAGKYLVEESESRHDLFMAAPEQEKEQAPEPFDLARAMAGEPIMFRDWSEATFLDYDERREAYIQVAVKNRAGYINERSIFGYAPIRGNGDRDLVMKPKEKQTRRMEVWQRRFIDESLRHHYCYHYRVCEAGDRVYWDCATTYESPPLLRYSWDES